jgi:hypothetical protein
MDWKLREIIAGCISDMERGASVEECLKRHPGLEESIRPHIEMWASLNSSALVQPSTSAFNLGRQAMLTAVASGPTTGFWKPALAPAAAVLAAAFLVFGGAGASAALGGPDVADDAVGGFTEVFTSKNDGGVSDENDGLATNLGKQCDEEPSPSPEAPSAPEAPPSAEEDANRGHGNDADHDDENNPGQGEGNHGTDKCGEDSSDSGSEPQLSPDASPEASPSADGDENRGHGNDTDHDDEDNPGQGQGNHGTSTGSGNGGGGGNANANGQGNGNGQGNTNSQGNGHDNSNADEPPKTE